MNIHASEELRQKAIKQGLMSIPKDYPALIKRLDTNENILSKQKIALGKRLFYEKRLSLNADISCATCHDIKKGGADGLETAVGYKNRKNPSNINTPTVFNTALSKKYFWDGSESTLYAQAKGPIIASFEMASSPTLIEERLNKIDEYKEDFLNVYGTTRISFDKVLDAISGYEKTLLTRGRFDEFLEGDIHVLNDEEKKGLELFLDKGCVTCHNGVNLGGQDMRKFPLVRHAFWSYKEFKPIQNYKKIKKVYDDFLSVEDCSKELYETKERMLKDKLGTKMVEIIKKGFFEQFENKDAYEIMSSKGCYYCHDKKRFRVPGDQLKNVAFPFKNTGMSLGDRDRSRTFRTPLLRNTASTKPYFHNGNVKLLDDVIKIMYEHQLRIKPDKEEIGYIVKFLKSVDGEPVKY